MTTEPVPPVSPSSETAGAPPSAPLPLPRAGVLGAVLALLVAALAFLLASTPARNSDLWLHLASGRALARGEAPPGADPFASTTAGALWVNHAWLGDIALYGIYELGDGRALVIAKAVLVAALAGLLLLFRRPGRLGLVAFAATVAVVALGPWLVLQPALFSLVGVALTLYLLERPSLVDGEEAERARRRRWLLVPLFALWANLDAWFLLGPALVALYAAGEALRRLLGGARDGRAGELRAPALLALAGLAACLLTPYHYHAFAWPVPLGLSHAERAIMHDPLGQGLVVSPFAAPLATAPALASPGGWAYCLLLAAGLASFGLGGRAPHPGRLVAWLALAALSLYQARAIPFFAAAAGPILALNLQEWAALRERQREGDKETRRQKLFALVLLSLPPCVLVCLLVLAWPGWLQPAPHQPRAWAVERDDSLVRLAETLGRWHADGKLRDDRFALTLSPTAAHYLAWFCPSEKGFLDSRWPLFDRVADDFVAMRRCLLRPEGAGPDPALGALLDAHRIDRIILHDPEFGQMSRAFRCLLLGRDEWDLLALEGDTALFGRRGGSESPSAWKPLDLRQAAYRPVPDLATLPSAPRAPRPRGTLDPFYRTTDDRPADRAEAALYLIYFDVAAGRTQARLESQWLAAQATGLLGSGSAGDVAGTAGALVVRLALTPLLSPPSGAQRGAEQFAAGFLASRDRGPPEAALLAVRAARRALAANPDDAGAFLLLGEAYLRLARQTREQAWQSTLPLLGSIRRAQALTALEQAGTLNPDLEEAHALLAQLYFEQGQMDRALEHLRAQLRVVERETAKGGPGARADDDKRAALRQDVEGLESLVRRSEKTYEVNTADKSAPLEVVDRARLAARHGLSRKALDMLLKSYPAIFGKGGTQMQVDLMLQAGRAHEVRAWLEPDYEGLLGFSSYHSFQAQAAAACGDYAAADAELALLSDQLRLVGVSRDMALPLREAVALQAGRAVLAGPVYVAGPPGLASVRFQQYEVLRTVGGAISLLRQRADSEVLRGLLALEAGAVGVAREHFRAALEVWGGEEAAASGAGVDFVTRSLAEHEMSRLE